MTQTLSNGHPEEKDAGKEFISARLSETSPDHDLTPALARTAISPADAESYFNSIRSSRANSIYSLSRISFSSQFSQLTTLHLPDASWLSISISSLPTAAAATNALSVAAEQIRRWLKKATEVLIGLDAEDDVDWAAAGGRQGLGEVDAAVGKFETLITSYVIAIENIQGREDIFAVSAELNILVQQMEKILEEWEKVRQLLKGIKSQVELAMEWEELWNHVLGDIGLEVENLGRLIFEMEEARHRTIADPQFEDSATIDVQELETIVEEAPTTDGEKSNRRFTLPSAFSAVSPTSPAFATPQEDSRLLALFARMQPLRASLDFLPMTLSSFRTRAVTVLPTACQELDDRRKTLEKKWKALERDAESLRRELGEDRWILVFKNASRQAQKLCESVERSISRLQESIDLGTQHTNPPVLAKKIESYEAKKVHYGPAIERVLAIIDKGVMDRLTVNGEILRLQQDTRGKWKAIQAEIKDMDLALDDLTTSKNQQLRDSISTIVSMDRSATGSVVDTPRSSPASSPVIEPASATKGESQHAATSRSSRRSSVVSNNTSRPAGSRRYASMPHGLASASQLLRKNSESRSLSDSRNPSPSPSSRSSSTPKPSTRPSRPGPSQSDYKPRWNSSPKVEHLDFSRNPKPSPLPSSTPNRKSSMTFRTTPLSAPSRSTNPPLPSPLGRSYSPAPSNSVSRLRHSSGTHSSLGMRQSSSPSAPTISRPKAVSQTSTPQLSSPASRRQSILPESPLSGDPSNTSPSARPRLQRPLTAMASRRSSMLPIPKSVLESGRESPLIGGPSGRESSLGNAARRVSSGRESVMDGERRWK